MSRLCSWRAPWHEGEWWIGLQVVCWPVLTRVCSHRSRAKSKTPLPVVAVVNTRDVLFVIDLPTQRQVRVGHAHRNNLCGDCLLCFFDCTRHWLPRTCPRFGFLRPAHSVVVKAAHGHLVVLPGFMEVMAFAYAVLLLLLLGSIAPLTLCVGVPWCSQVWVPDLQWSKTATRWRALVPALSLPVQEHALGKTSASPASCVWYSWAC